MLIIRQRRGNSSWAVCATNDMTTTLPFASLLIILRVCALELPIVLAKILWNEVVFSPVILLTDHAVSGRSRRGRTLAVQLTRRMLILGHVPVEAPPIVVPNLFGGRRRVPTDRLLVG